MDQNLSTAITAAAVTATGPQTAFTQVVTAPNGETMTVVDPAAWQAAVVGNAIQIAVMASESGAVGRALKQIEESKVFTCTVVSVEKEARSTRGFVIVHTGTERAAKDMRGNPLPEGFEVFRTERTDSPIGVAMARKIRGLIGHRVLVWVEVEPIPGDAEGRKARVVRHVEDLGVDAEAGSKSLQPQPA